MPCEDLELRELRVEDKAAFREAVREFDPSSPEMPFAFEYNEAASFQEYVEKLAAWARGERLPLTFVPNSYYVGVVAGKIVGRLSFRHRLNDFLLRVGGHMGYCVVPSERRKGYATEMLRQSLPLARAMGLSRVLVTCDTGNIGSRRVIEKNGGVYEDTTDLPGQQIHKERYWIHI